MICPEAIAAMDLPDTTPAPPAEASFVTPAP
jgi:hypothetical protein